MQYLYGHNLDFPNILRYLLLMSILVALFETEFNETKLHYILGIEWKKWVNSLLEWVVSHFYVNSTITLRNFFVNSEKLGISKDYNLSRYVWNVLPWYILTYAFIHNLKYIRLSCSHYFRQRNLSCLPISFG